MWCTQKQHFITGEKNSFLGGEWRRNTSLNHSSNSCQWEENMVSEVTQKNLSTEAKFILLFCCILPFSVFITLLTSCCCHRGQILYFWQSGCLRNSMLWRAHVLKAWTSSAQGCWYEWDRWAAQLSGWWVIVVGVLQWRQGNEQSWAATQDTCGELNTLLITWTWQKEEFSLKHELGYRGEANREVKLMILVLTLVKQSDENGIFFSVSTMGAEWANINCCFYFSQVHCLCKNNDTEVMKGCIFLLKCLYFLFSPPNGKDFLECFSSRKTMHLKDLSWLSIYPGLYNIASFSQKLLDLRT